MDWVNEEQNNLSRAVQDWIDQFLIAKEPHQIYREALIATLHTTWPNQSEEKSPGFILLPGLCAQALGIQPSRLLPLHAAWALLYIAYYLLDKVEDEETEHAVFARFGTGGVNNLTTGLILHAQRMLIECADEMAVDAAALHTIQMTFNQQALAVCAGQHLDLTLAHPSLAQAWEIVNAKSGQFFSLGSYLGARLATHDPAIINVFTRFGLRLGVVIQIANDLHGLGTADQAGGDLAQGKQTLPVAYALHILPPDQQSQLRALLEAATKDPQAEAEARKRIVEAGALTYLALEIERLRHMAITDFQPFEPQVSALLNLLHRTIDTRNYLRKGMG